MKRNILKSILESILIMGLCWACYDDKGNYDYIRLDEVQIDTAGLDIWSEYALYRYDSLTIEPVVYFQGKPVTVTDSTNYDLDFCWTIYRSSTGVGMTYTVDTLSRNVKFSDQVTQLSGKWTLLFTVTQKQTGVQTYCSFSLQIDESVSDGWLVLYEREGDTDAGLIVNDRVKKNVTKERIFRDLYSASNGGKRMKGKPVGVFHSVAPLQSGEVLLASEEDLTGVDKNSFECTFDFEKLFWNTPAVCKVSWIGGNFLRREITINNNQVYYVNYMSAGLYRSTAFGEPCQGTYGELAPWMAGYYSASYEAVVYDQTNGCFLCVDANGVNVLPFAQQDNEDLDVNQVGMEMVLSDWGRNFYEHSIMKSGNRYELVVCNFFQTNRNSSQIMTKRYDMTDNPGISSVSSMAAGVNGEFIYYGSDDGVYLYKYNTGQKAEKVWPVPDTDEKVSCVRIQKFYYPQFVNMGILINAYSVIYIATWNEDSQSGTVYQLLCNPSNGAIDLTSERSYSGFGKVKDMSWKWSM